MISVLGVLVIIAAIAGNHVSERHILDEWRRAEPRAWASVMRPARRAFPFSVFARSTALEIPRKIWSTYMPEWAMDRPEARKWVRRYQWSALLIVVGFLLTIVPLLLRSA